MFTLRTIVILVTAVFVGCLAGGLAFLAGQSAAGAVLVGGGAAGATLVSLHKLIK